jgi:hypothetical protein
VVGPPEAQALPEGLRAADGGGGGGGGGGDSDDWAAEGLGMAAAPAAAPAAAAAAPSYMYDLFAVSHHEGGLGGGHYTASVQDFATGKWWFCDDRDATPAFPEDCRRESAYVLFYRRKDTLGPELAEANAVAAAAEGAASAANPAGGGGGGSGGVFVAPNGAVQAADPRNNVRSYVAHCVETALIVEGLLSPTEDDARAETAVIAALLHDVLDDTPVGLAAVEAGFGPAVASIVSKVSQLSATNQLVRRRLRLRVPR